LGAGDGSGGRSPTPAAGRSDADHVPGLDGEGRLSGEGRLYPVPDEDVLARRAVLAATESRWAHRASLAQERDPGGRQDLEDDEGNISLTVEGETEVHKPAPGQPPARSPLLMPMEGVVFPHPGQYTFRVKVKGKTFQGPGIHLMEIPAGEATA